MQNAPGAFQGQCQIQRILMLQRALLVAQAQIVVQQAQVDTGTPRIFQRGTGHRWQGRRHAEQATAPLAHRQAESSTRPE
ncbi:MAG: hypothetical protein QM599_03160 [Pseudoxanthomonas sp.]